MAKKLSLRGGRIEFPGSRTLVYRQWKKVTSQMADMDVDVPFEVGEKDETVDEKTVSSDTPSLGADGAAEMPSGIPYALRPRG